MSSCSPSSLVFGSSLSLTSLKASGSLPSIIKFSQLKPESLKASGTIPSWQDTLSKINKIKLPSLESLSSSSSPKSFIDYSKINFNSLNNYKPNSLKASSSVPSWQDTINKIKDLNFPSLSNKDYSMFKASASPKSFDYMDFKIPKFEPFKIKNNLESSASSPSILDFSHSKTKENNRFWYLNKNKENEDCLTKTNYFNILEEKKNKTLKIRDFPNSGFQLHIHEENDVIKEAGIKIYGEKKQFKVLYPGKKNPYEISMMDLYADKLNLNKIIK